MARLEAEDIGVRWAPAAAGWQDGGFLRTVDGRCVFLRDDKLCAVHVLIGADAKPGFCREFPYHFVEDPRGTVAVVRATCKGFGESFRDGPLVTNEDARASDVAHQVPRRRFFPDRVEVVPGYAVDLARWMVLEDEILAAVQGAEGEPPELVARVREQLYQAAGADAVPVRAEQALAAEEALLRALRIVMGRVVEGPGGTPDQRAFAAAALDRIAVAHDAVGQPPAPMTAEARAYANLLLRSAILSKRFASVGGVADGLGGWLLGAIVARRNAEDPSAVALGRSWSDWERFEAIEMVTALLRRARPALVDLFLHVGWTGSPS